MTPPTRRLPSGVFVSLAVALMLVGGAWWVRSSPPAAASAGPPAALVPRSDNGRILTYESGVPAVSIPAAVVGTTRPCRRTSHRTVHPTERDRDGRGGPTVRRSRCNPAAPPSSVSYFGGPSPAGSYRGEPSTGRFPVTQGPRGR